MANLNHLGQSFLALWIMIGLFSVTKGAFGTSDKVLLRDVSVLTLYHGRMTPSRRSSPVPQLKCVGGTAGCESFVPQVVQCYNRGTDGYDVQWECKTDMDNAYRFGSVEVSCEGYDYPEDPYVLKGSCGVEFTLDLTKEGYEKKQNSGHSYYGNENQYEQQQNSHSTYSKPNKGSIFGDLLTLAVIAGVIYVIYRYCLSGTGSDRSEDSSRRSGGPPRSSPPPPGFRDEYTQGDGCSSTYSDSSSYGQGSTHHTRGAGAGTSTGGGFWGGAAMGGLLGYMFGNSRTRTGYQQPYGNTGWGSGWGNGWGNSWSSGWGSSNRHRSSGGWGGSSRSSFGGSGGMFGGSGSTGTRTASGFGGTKRR